MSNAARAFNAYEAYIEPVKAEFRGPRYDWLLERLSESKYSRLPVEVSFLSILDFGDDAAPKEALRVAASDNLQDRVLDALNSKLLSTATRVVLLYYPSKNYLNEECLGVLGNALGLDPQFFITHFRLSYRDRLDIQRRPPSLPHLNTNVLQFQFEGGSYVTTCLVQNIVVILYEHWSRDPLVIKKLSEPLLTNSSCFQDDEAESNLKLSPIDLLALALQAESLNPVTAVDIENDGVVENRLVTETVLSAQMVVGNWKSGCWECYWRDRIKVEATVRNLSAALASERWSKGHAPLAKRLLQEYHILLDRLHSQGEYIREGVQQINALSSMEETRRGVQQSDSVRRLTLIAFIFIPLNFATSFFGMKVQQLGTGSTNIGYFFLAAVSAGRFAILLSSIVKPLEHRLQHRRKETADDLFEDVEMIQNREILRQSSSERDREQRWLLVDLMETPGMSFERPGPKFRKASKLSANNRWKKLTTSFRGSTASA